MSSVERDRLAELRDAVERRQSGRGLPTYRQLFRVYDGGSLPVAVPAVFLTHPVGLGVAEAEGATPSITPDTSQSVPVLILGPAVPAVGDDVAGVVISGRWVAGMQGGVVAPPCGIFIACAACGGIHFAPIGDTLCGVSPIASRTTYYGAVTDSNGTWPLIRYGPSSFITCANNSAGSPKTGIIRVVSYTVVYDDFGEVVSTDCSPVDVEFPYKYVFSCESDGRVSLSLLAATSDCAGPTQFAVGAVTPGIVESDTASAACAGGTLTASFAFPATSFGADPPSATASVAMNVESVDQAGRRCCTPCSIPRADLTISSGGGGGVTLYWHADSGSWSYPFAETIGGHIIYTLGCSISGTALLYDPSDAGASPLTLKAWTCDPLHLTFDDGFGGNVYVDE